MEQLPENVMSIDLIKFERNRNKLCECNSLHVTIDTKNRKLYCQHCQAERDPFEVVSAMGARFDEINERLEKSLQQKKDLDNYKPHLKIIKELESKTRAGNNQMHPICPCCDEPFMLAELTRFYGAKFVNGRILERIDAQRKSENEGSKK
ncbi:hypothetical protein AAGS61_08630 [Lysinibacillus sp. KU-BSD001]|uniref:hypothetical protein n=1 Tax=Lysinibacillus sp. KU-BSD001 TaxID=3141328 RepID=UPI0036E2E6A0